MKTGFFQVRTREQVWELFERFPVIGTQDLDLEQACDRVLAEALVAPEDLPGFPRAIVDGYAVRARDTFGAAQSAPALLEVCGEVLMGECPAFEVRPGQAARIPTGGMLPAGADSVVMVEYTEELDRRSIALSRSVAPLENVIQPGDDVRRGEEVLAAGTKLRPQEIGLLAGLGMERVVVHRTPRVAILSSGDEIVPLGERPQGAQLRDINSHTLAAMVRRAGGTPQTLGVVPDREEALQQACQQALELADVCLISGGSSVGTRDLTLEVLSSFPDSELLVHGVAISPGKPTLLVRVGSKGFWGLPGHVTSALVVFQALVRPFLQRLLGLELSLGEGRSLRARMGRNVVSRPGREDFIRVRLQEKNGGLVAEPLFVPSALISSLVRADGLVRVERHAEGVYAGEEVEVWSI